MDLHDLEHNARDGLHIASLAGSWIALVAGFGGLRDHGAQLRFCPQLPADITRLGFAFHWRGSTFAVSITQSETTYTLRSGAEIEVLHDGEPLTLGADAVTRPTCRVQPLTPPPTQPAGREPARHSLTRNRN
jgi:alpha,alpha-trehalose phosphorylase